ncbi:MAG: hypothetical protein IJO20_00825 [Ruminococcus sp.]|nr:hypothetical protein [Ruminococcus sp.]
MKRKAAFLFAVVMLLLSCVFLVLTGDNSTKPSEEDIILIDGSLVEIEPPMNQTMADYAVRLFGIINDEHLSSNDCYFVLIPDKYKYLADKKAEYDEFYSYMSKSLSFATAIDVYDLLDASDYYRTDPHIKQECLVDVANRILESTGREYTTRYEENTVDTPFYGTYAHRSDLSVTPDELVYLTNDTIDNLYTAEGVSIYNFKKLDTDEPYDFFLSGNQTIVTINNENAQTDKRLIIFRDSFASSLAPLLCEGYSQVVLVDLRYIMSEYLVDFVDFENADVLFLYSTTVMNNSFSMK